MNTKTTQFITFLKQHDIVLDTESKRFITYESNSKVNSDYLTVIIYKNSEKVSVINETLDKNFTYEGAIDKITSILNQG
jgi:hypothetical protein